jgi:hypothetical protein
MKGIIMRTTLITALALTFLFNVCPAAAPSAGWSSVFCTEFQGTIFEQTVTAADTKDMPDWSPEEAECPLPLPKAIKLAREFLGTRFASVAKWTFVRFSMCQLKDGKWYYIIALCDGQPVFGSSMQGLQVFVGLNGWIPEIKEQASK